MPDVDPRDYAQIARLIAFYLPQYHPIPENDEWWGKGFTEWTNVTQARPLFKGHYQPRLPADLGFYDLRVPETRRAQADLAREYGVFGFCYYHYWLSGRQLMERPFDEVLASGEPDFPFCLCWANHDFNRSWLDNHEVILKQEYSPEDDRAHARHLIPAFTDPRYIRIGGKPLFLVYQAQHHADPKGMTERFREEAKRAGLPGLFLCRVECYHDRKRGLGDPRELGFDAAVSFHPAAGEVPVTPLYSTRRWVPAMKLGLISPAYRNNQVFDYPEYAQAAARREYVVTSYPRFPCVMPFWDNAARRRVSKATIFRGENPEVYRQWLTETLGHARDAARDAVPDAESPVVFINGWNEWAEGAHLEPCLRWGRAYLEATRDALRDAGRVGASARGTAPAAREAVAR
jgi:lipopolysaccharide biosynthesis protein